MHDRNYPLLIRVDVFWVGSRFWLVLIEKSNAGFPAVNPAYGDKRSHLILAIKYDVACVSVSVTHGF